MSLTGPEDIIAVLLTEPSDGGQLSRTTRRLGTANGLDSRSALLAIVLLISNPDIHQLLRIRYVRLLGSRSHGENTVTSLARGLL